MCAMVLNSKLNMLSSKDRILIKKCVKNIKKFLPEDLDEKFLTINGKDEHWTTFCESCE